MASVWIFVSFKFLFSLLVVSSELTIRLWPFDERKMDGFVEVYYNGEWGFLGTPDYRFDEPSASELCRILHISEFGYGGKWTPVGSYRGAIFSEYFECRGDGFCYYTSLSVGDTLDENSVTYNNRYGSSLHCVDSRLVNKETYNEGILQTNIYGKTYTVCFEGFNMNTAEVVCNNLGFDGALGISAVEPDLTHIYYKAFICDGSERSLLECNQSKDDITNCQQIVKITCKAVRLVSTNEYTDEGAVEIFYNGTWGFVGTPGFVFSDTTASYLCDRFGLGNAGFGTMAHSLETYDRIGWYGRLACSGNESHIMQCDMGDPSAVPPLQHTYMSGSWLYCFDFNITNVRLNGSSHRDGRVQLEVNGRWGSICSTDSILYEDNIVGNILCKAMGYRSVQSVYEGPAESSDLVWMSYVICTGDETDITECSHLKGSVHECPYYLGLICNDDDDCESNSCLNNGECIDALNGYTCECPRPWGGVRCEIDTEDNCASDACFNGAKCVDRVNSFECQCEDGFEGRFCQNNIRDCHMDTCENGGSCEDRIEGFICYCKDGFEGDRCETVVTNQTILIVILASAACALFVITVVIICCCVCYRRQKQKKGQPGEPLQSGESGRKVYLKSEEGSSDNYLRKENVYSISKSQTVYSTIKTEDEEDIYNVIKDVDVVLRVSAIKYADRKLKEDKYGYVSFKTNDTETSEFDYRGVGTVQRKDNDKRDGSNHELRDSYLVPTKPGDSEGILPTYKPKMPGGDFEGHYAKPRRLQTKYEQNESDPVNRKPESELNDSEDYDDTVQAIPKDNRIKEGCEDYPTTVKIENVRKSESKLNYPEDYDDIEQAILKDNFIIEGCEDYPDTVEIENARKSECKSNYPEDYDDIEQAIPKDNYITEGCEDYPDTIEIGNAQKSESKLNYLEDYDDIEQAIPKDDYFIEGCEDYPDTIELENARKSESILNYLEDYDDIEQAIPKDDYIIEGCEDYPDTIELENVRKSGSKFNVPEDYDDIEQPFPIENFVMEGHDDYPDTTELVTEQCIKSPSTTDDSNSIKPDSNRKCYDPEDYDDVEKLTPDTKDMKAHMDTNDFETDQFSEPPNKLMASSSNGRDV